MIAAAPMLGSLALTGAKKVFASLGGGSARDAARAARAQYFTETAIAGSVMAGRMILGGLGDVASNEKSMYEAALSAAESSRPDVMAAARAAGGYWNRTDSAESYPISRQLVESDLAGRANSTTPIASADANATRMPTVYTTAAAPAPAPDVPSSNKMLLIAGAAVLGVVAVLVLRGHR